MARKGKKQQSTSYLEREAAENLIKAQKLTGDMNFRIDNKFELRPSHQSLLEIIKQKNTNIVIIDGPAGSAKTFCSVFAALILIQSRCKDQIKYIRTIAESAAIKMGSLPGEVDEKFGPWIMPLQEKLRELIPKETEDMLFAKEYIKPVPVNFLRGCTFKDDIVIIDEAQNLELAELTTAMTRFGENSKLLIIGDTRQADIHERSGFKHVWNAFNDEQAEDNGIYTFKFSEDDITRSPLLSFIIHRLEEARLSN